MKALFDIDEWKIIEHGFDPKKQDKQNMPVQSIYFEFENFWPNSSPEI